jgi:hypothetical protein
VIRNTAKSDKALWDTMKRLFSDAEIVETTMASAMFNMINRLNDTFWTELETVEYNLRQSNAVKGVTVADIESFASGFAAAGRGATPRGESGWWRSDAPISAGAAGLFRIISSLVVA